MSYSTNFTTESITDLSKIDSNNKLRIVRKIKWLQENFEQITPIPLTGNLIGYFKLRIGDYRVIYSIDYSSKILIIHRIGHRREIYD
jgi:mRNA interferase RelE/StbE